MRKIMFLWLYVVAIVASLGGLLSGYDTGVISGALLFINETWILPDTLQGFLVSSVLIGAVIGAVTSLTTAFMNMPNEISKVDSSIRTNLDTINEYSNNINKTYDDINKQAEGVVALTTVHSNLVKELENIVDANGKIKEGYEERAKFIVTTLNNAYGTEISISNNKIENYKKEISYIKDIIKNEPFSGSFFSFVP